MTALDAEIHHGDPARPVCILIHGLGMSKTIWTDPRNARLLGGLSSIGRLLVGGSGSKTVFHDLVREGYTVCAYSQRRPMGPMVAQVQELADLIQTCAADRKIVLIGHSRGGIIGRAYAEAGGGAGISGLITIASPHAGSELARWALYARPLAQRLARIIPGGDNPGLALGAAKRVLGLFGSRAMEELLPDSSLIRCLSPSPPSDMMAYSMGGTDPNLFHIGRLFSYPASLKMIFPESALLPEMYLGDGLVTPDSARLAYALEHKDFALNHIHILMNRTARRTVMGWVRTISDHQAASITTGARPDQL